jgi:hypothetical protein
VKLDVATTQSAGRKNISIGKRDPESVRSSWFAVINHSNVKTERTKQVCDRRTTEITTQRTLADCGVAGNARASHVKGAAMVEEVQVTEKRMMLASRYEPEICLMSGIFKDKSAAGNEIAWTGNDVGTCICAKH